MAPTQKTLRTPLKTTIAQGLKTLQAKFGKKPPDVAVVLGSGLASFADELIDAKKLPYSKIPGFAQTNVPGHRGECVVGKVGERRVLVFGGRFHYYEGYPIEVTALPVRIAGAWGIEHLVVTNAAGGIRKSIRPGTLMLIRDHINLMGVNPLRGPNLADFGPRFSDMTFSYDRDFRAFASAAANQLGIILEEGIYAALPGPSYETPAEIEMLRILGADAVGMSTVPEVITARHQNMRVLGISIITNQAAGNIDAPITHEEVLENTDRARNDFTRFLLKWLKSYEES